MPKLDKFRKPADEPSWYDTVHVILKTVASHTLGEDNSWVMKARKLLGKGLSDRAVAFCAWELYYGSPPLVARLRTLHAVHGAWQR